MFYEICRRPKFIATRSNTFNSTSGGDGIPFSPLYFSLSLNPSAECARGSHYKHRTCISEDWRSSEQREREREKEEKRTKWKMHFHRSYNHRHSNDLFRPAWVHTRDMLCLPKKKLRFKKIFRIINGKWLHGWHKWSATAKMEKFSDKMCPDWNKWTSFDFVSDRNNSLKWQPNDNAANAVHMKHNNVTAIVSVHTYERNINNKMRLFTHPMRRSDSMSTSLHTRIHSFSGKFFTVDVNFISAQPFSNCHSKLEGIALLSVRLHVIARQTKNAI